MKVLQQEHRVLCVLRPHDGLFQSRLHAGAGGPALHRQRGPVLLVAGIQSVGRLIASTEDNISEIVHYQVGMRILEAAGSERTIAMLGTGRFGILVASPTPEVIQQLIDTIEDGADAGTDQPAFRHRADGLRHALLSIGCL